ncbi:type 1 glutamine amidotransferase [Candidatus Poribacteria bacterium]|nr:type 1 glutamine amidotransferase [Candidatus Poribacteria bacterium]
MKLHYLQHVLFEDIANIREWAQNKNYLISKTLLYNNETLPDISDFDWLVVMGGPMNIYEENKYPWLIKEKKFIEKSITAGKIVIGICLGAQLIADVLGAKITKNKYKEIGWFPVTLSKGEKNISILNDIPDLFTAFHWHGDTFEIPKDAIKIAKSKACENQAFIYNNHVLGLQFHLESSVDSINKLIENCNDELIDGKYIQKSKEIISQFGNIQNINNIMNKLFYNMELY